MCWATFTAKGCPCMPPEEDARAILRLALRHEQSLAASLDPAFAQENWGFLAQQCVENLLSHDLVRLQILAGARLPEELLDLQDFAVKARYSPDDTPLPASRQQLLGLLRQLRGELEARLEAMGPA